jgi:hypothetical protein
MMLSIAQIAQHTGRSESFIWKLTKLFDMKPDKQPQRRIGKPGLYNFNEFTEKAKTGLYDGRL